jgi:hypothetical protein
MMTDFLFYCPTCDRTFEDGCGDGHGRCTTCGCELEPLIPGIPYQPAQEPDGLRKHFSQETP